MKSIFTICIGVVSFFKHSMPITFNNRYCETLANSSCNLKIYRYCLTIFFYNLLVRFLVAYMLLFFCQHRTKLNF